MTIGSLFDGIGGFPLSGQLIGARTLWSCEIDPQCRAVTGERFPGVRQYQDIAQLSGFGAEPVDVICGGSPCQDLSIAGNRAGIRHKDKGDETTTRSGLFMDQVRIVKEMREATGGKHPRLMVWESLTARSGGGIGACLYPGGVTGTITASKGGECPERGQGFKVVALRAGAGAKAGGIGYSDEAAPTLKACSSGLNQAPSVVYDYHQQAARVKPVGDVAPTVVSKYGTGGNNTPLVQTEIVRRMMPFECERLQGYPDGWTGAAYNGKPMADSPRYRMIGNSVAIPCVVFVLAACAELIEKHGGQKQ